MEDMIIEKKYASHVVSVENGLELISEYSRLLDGNVPVSIAILDLNMPIMDGVTAARTMRTLESARNSLKTPIVFFSGRKADESLKTLMETLEPANYVNKGSDPDPDKLASRVEYLFSYVLGKKSEPKE